MWRVNSYALEQDKNKIALISHNQKSMSLQWRYDDINFNGKIFLSRGTLAIVNLFGV